LVCLEGVNTDWGWAGGGTHRKNEPELRNKRDSPGTQMENVTEFNCNHFKLEMREPVKTSFYYLMKQSKPKSN